MGDAKKVIIYYNEKKRMCPQEREDIWQSINDKNIDGFYRKYPRLCK